MLALFFISFIFLLFAVFLQYFCLNCDLKAFCVHLFSMTDSCLLICVHECLQYPHYLHMIIVTINRFFFLSTIRICFVFFFAIAFNNSPINSQSKCLAEFFDSNPATVATSMIRWQLTGIDDDHDLCSLWNVRHFFLKWNTSSSFQQIYKLQTMPHHFYIVITFEEKKE